jgi:DNA polymerase III delta prime subunit
MVAETPLWYDKYRPQTFDDYVWSDDRTKELIMDWVAKGTIPSMILTGGPGRGKSALADLIIMQLGVDEDDVLRLRGATDNTAETVRTRIQEFCELGGWSGLRIVLFNEADMLSHVAQGMLRTMMDDFSSSVRFVFTCNYPHRIIEPISSSRLLRIDIDKLSYEDFFRRMAEILMAEEIDLDDTAVSVAQQIADHCYPDLRKAINVMQHSVRDGALKSMHEIKSAAGVWEAELRGLFQKYHDPLREIIRIRDLLALLSPDEMEEVYRFLYQNGTELFGAKQIQAIIVINNGQKAHRAALLPDMILLEVILRLMGLMKPNE